MRQTTLETTLSGLLSNIGIPLCRSGIPGKPGDVAAGFLKGCPLPAAIPAPVTFAADLLSGTAGEDGSLVALESVFTHLNGYHPGLTLPLATDDRLHLPAPDTKVTREDYKALAGALRRRLDRVRFDEAGLPGLLSALEDCLGFVPAGGEADLSLFDKSRLTAAIAACVCEYLQDHPGDPKSPAFRETPAFLLYSADFSGIQKFIFTVGMKGALASLRSRSFFLELLMEHYMDELLTACGVSRVNLLYSGGGHCYMLLPNTDSVTRALHRWNTRFNDWLLDQFGSLIFMAHGFTPCCGNELVNHPAGQDRYTALFRRVSAAISRHKLCRCTPAQLLRLNAPDAGEDGRECIVCGRSHRLNAQSRCPWCALFISLSQKILKQEVFPVSRESAGSDFSLPAWEGDVHFTLTDEKTARTRLERGEPMVRIYEKNRTSGTLPGGIRLHVGDYAAEKDMSALSARSQGIRRLAVCRMDVDNLGHAFTSGFRTPGETDPAKKDRYLTLARTSAFSRQMSLFFKHHINAILSAGPAEEAPAVAIVYSGGDDVFLVGAWDGVLTAALRIRDAFCAFCGGSLTLSAGISLHQDTFPIRTAAGMSAELEEKAKSLPGKNALALFDPESDHTYSWTDFRDKVLSEKLTVLQRFFRAENQERGNNFLYQLLELLRAREEKIHLARYAYLLARMEPRERDRKEVYRAFARDMYRWAISETDRKELITAITLYIYMERKEN